MRLIDADALLPMMRYTTIDSEIGIFPIKIGFKEIVRVIDDAPTVEAEPVRHGHWIEHPFSAVFEKVHSKDQIVCSCCEEAFNAFFNETERFKYCPNCGAKMDEREEE